MLVNESQVQERIIQEAFRVSANHQSAECPFSPENLEGRSLNDGDVSVVLAGHVDWD